MRARAARGTGIRRTAPLLVAWWGASLAASSAASPAASLAVLRATSSAASLAGGVESGSLGVDTASESAQGRLQACRGIQGGM